MMTAAEAGFQKSLASAFQDYCPQGSGPSVSSLEASKRSPTTGTVPNYSKQDSPKESTYWTQEASNGIILTQLKPASPCYPPAKKVKYEVTSPVTKVPPGNLGSLTPLSSKYRRKSQISTPTNVKYSPLSVASSVEKTPKSAAKTRRTPKSAKNDTEDGKDDMGRQDSSLLRLTRLFLEQNMTDDNGVVNLNDAADRLNVQKRRLYDITNVLEGINMIEKVGKNSIRWKHQDGEENTAEKQELLAEVEQLRAQEIRLDALLHDVTNALGLLKEEPIEQPYMYIKFSDLRTIPTLQGNTVIAIKAPKDSISSIEVSDPQETGLFDMAIRNQQNERLSAYYMGSDNPDDPVEMGESHAHQLGAAKDVKINHFDYKPLSQHNSRQDISESPVFNSGFSTFLTPTRQPSFYDEWDQPSSSLQPQYFVSPLKMVMDPTAGTSTSLMDLGTSDFLPLEPAPEAASYMYGMTDGEFDPSNLYNQDQTW